MKKYGVFLMLFLLSMNSVSAEGGNYLTGLNWWGPFIGLIILCVVGVITLILIIKHRNFFMKLFVATIFGGCGAMIGTLFLPNHSMILSFALFVLGYWLSSKILKMQGNKLVHVNTGNSREYGNDNFNTFDDDFDDDFGGDD